MNNFAVGFVLYNADELMFSRIESVAKSGRPVYVYDNSPNRHCSSNLAVKHQCVYYFSDADNSGLGVGISDLCKKAYEDGCPTLLFFDQDTIFSQKTLYAIEEFYLTNHELDPYSVIVFKQCLAGAAGTAKLRDVLLAINSGSLFFLQKVAAIGWHDPSYFVDGVDYKFCLDSLSKGYRVGAYGPTPDLDHITAQDDDDWILWGVSFRARRYSAVRFKDTIISSIRLIGAGLLRGKFRFTYKVAAFFGFYLLQQFAVRLPWARRVND